MHLTVIDNPELTVIKSSFEEVETEFNKIFGDYMARFTLYKTHTSEDVTFLKESISDISDIMHHPLVQSGKSEVTVDMAKRLYDKMTKWAEVYGM